MITVMYEIDFGIIRPLLTCGIDDKFVVPMKAELIWSGTILSHGYNIACLAIWWRDWDFKNENSTKRRCQEWSTFSTKPVDNYFPGM